MNFDHIFVYVVIRSFTCKMKIIDDIIQIIQTIKTCNSKYEEKQLFIYAKSSEQHRDDNAFVLSPEYFCMCLLCATPQIWRI